MTDQNKLICPFMGKQCICDNCMLWVNIKDPVMFGDSDFHGCAHVSNALYAFKTSADLRGINALVGDIKDMFTYPPVNGGSKGCVS